MNGQDKITYRILLKLSLVWGNITKGTYNVENCNLKHNKKILRGLNKTAFDFIKLCQDGTTGKSVYDIMEVMQQIENIKNNLKP